ncbi:hypothetical protein KH5H1_54240 [Corallococcus caeni]|nr:hypothetical protein KH5H1_54240 [Corallococcus sp. KH5-1]
MERKPRPGRLSQLVRQSDKFRRPGWSGGPGQGGSPNWSDSRTGLRDPDGAEAPGQGGSPNWSDSRTGFRGPDGAGASARAVLSIGPLVGPVPVVQMARRLTSQGGAPNPSACRTGSRCPDGAEAPGQGGAPYWSDCRTGSRCPDGAEARPGRLCQLVRLSDRFV